jgi:hypothetical protein
LAAKLNKTASTPNKPDLKYDNLLDHKKKPGGNQLMHFIVQQISSLNFNIVIMDFFLIALRSSL